MNGMPAYQCQDDVVTAWDRWQEAEAKALVLAEQLDVLKNALRIMGVNPDSLLDNKSHT